MLYDILRYVDGFFPFTYVSSCAFVQVKDKANRAAYITKVKHSEKPARYF